MQKSECTSIKEEDKKMIQMYVNKSKGPGDAEPGFDGETDKQT